jgi:hypothetical protein
MLSLSYVYHATVYWSFRLVWKTIIFFTPTSFIQAAVIANMAEWGIRVIVPADDKKNETNAALSSSAPLLTNTKTPPPKCTMVVHDRRFFRQVAVDPLLALGEAYMNQWVDCSDLIQQIVLLTGPKTKDSWVFRTMLWLRNDYVTAHNQQTKGRKSMEVVHLHYNLGNDLYRLMVDEKYVLRCCFFCGAVFWCVCWVLLLFVCRG